MKRRGRFSLAALALLATRGLAYGHDLTALKLVNGKSTAEVSSYPATLNFTFTISDANPSSPSTVLSATDPLFETLTTPFQFTPAPPQIIPVGGALVSNFTLTLNSLADCTRFGALDGNPNTPGLGPDSSFTNTFNIAWDSGSAQSSVFITCHPNPTFACDDTIYFENFNNDQDLFAKLDPLTAQANVVSSSFAYQYDAIGFNHLDGYIYGITNSVNNVLWVNHLIRIGSDGIVQDLGAVNGLPAGPDAIYMSGTFLPDGTFLVSTQMQAVGGRGLWAGIDVKSKNITMSGTISNGINMDFRDWAVSPNDKIVYYYDSIARQIGTFDPITGTATNIGPQGLSITRTDAIAFTRAGQLLAYGAGALGGSANSLYQIDLKTFGVTLKAGPGQTAVAADLATCALGNAGASVTRNAGFYMTHEQPLAACLASGAIDLGTLGTIDRLESALSLLWDSPAVDARGKVRTEEEGTQLRLAQQLLSSVCNQRLFGAVDAQSISPVALSLEGEALTNQLNHWLAANDVGDSFVVPAFFDVGVATPSHAFSIASGQR